MDATREKAKVRQWKRKLYDFEEQTKLDSVADKGRLKIGEGKKIETDDKISDIIEEKKKEKIFNKIDETRLELDKMSEDGRAVFRKYAGDMEADLDRKDSGYYYNGKIYLDIGDVDENDKALGYKKAMTVFYHEAWHWMDSNALGEGEKIRDKLVGFRKNIKQDVLDRCSKVTGIEFRTLQFLEVRRQNWGEIIDDFRKDKYLKNGIQDILSGVTKNKLGTNKWGWHHATSYWKGDNLEAEAIAEMGEAFMEGGKKLEYMQEYFPTAYRQFYDFVKKYLLGGE